MTRLVAITGTDTEVGKTWIGCQLVDTLHARGIDVRAVKLLESGTKLEPQPIEDGCLLARAARQATPTAALRRYRAPLTPADAARLDGSEVDIERVETELLTIASNAELTIVEGAGGLLAPLAPGRSLLNIIADHDAPAILVAPDRLGMQNHTLLTIAALRSAGVDPIAVVINRMPGSDKHRDPSIGRNSAMLREVEPSIRLLETVHPGWADSLAELIES